jgi:hypothetical protein
MDSTNKIGNSVEKGFDGKTDCNRTNAIARFSTKRYLLKSL